MLSGIRVVWRLPPTGTTGEVWPVADTVALRPLVVEDAVVMAAVLADPALYEFTGGEPPSVAELRTRYTILTRGRSADGTEEWINMVVVLGHRQEPIGYVQATVPRDGDPAEIAWVIGRAWQGQGHATRAAQLLVDRLQQRGVRDLAAHIHPNHTASQAIARTLGLSPTDAVVEGEVRWQRISE